MVNTCRYCSAPISWMQGANGKSKPVNPDGSDHRCQSSQPAQSAPIAPPVNGTHTEPIIPTAAPVAPVPLVVTPPANETTVRQVSVRPDSLEIGTPGKNGALKIYMDFSDAADCEQRIRTAVAMRELANQLITAPMEMVRA